MADREPVELTDSAKRKLAQLESARELGSGGASRVVESKIRRNSALQLALDAAKRASGASPGKRANQSTDSNQ